jgi:hypothetical protein
MQKNNGPGKPHKELEPMLMAVKEEADDEALPRFGGKRKHLVF